MRVISADDLARTFTFPRLIEALRQAFRSADRPFRSRHHHPIERPGEPAATLLLMPAWTDAGSEGGFLGVKIVTVYPGNAARSLPSIFGTYLLMDGATGAPLAAIDGQALTLWRTAAASALAASYLAREDASRLVDGRRRRARALPHPRACERPPDRRGADLEPQCRRAPNNSPRRSPAVPTPVRATTRSRSGGATTPTSSPARRSLQSRWSAAHG